MTTSGFETYLAASEQGSQSEPDRSLEERASILEDRVAAHTGIYEAMARRTGEVSEAHRPLIPLYQRWINAARQLVIQARGFRAQGRPIAGIDELVCAINLAKFVGQDFDHTIDFNDRARRGELGSSIPWSEVDRELRTRRESQGKGTTPGTA